LSFRLSNVILDPSLYARILAHENEEATLGEGQLVTPQMFVDLMTGLGRSTPLEILPERLIVRTADTIVWWAPNCHLFAL